MEEICELNVTVHYQFVDFKKAYVLVKREVSCNIVIEFGIGLPIELIRLI
jgi:hypothetical protein